MYQVDRGYKSQTVTYTLAWLAHHVKVLGRASLNWNAIWSTQDVPEELQDFLKELAPQIAAAIRDTPANARNVGEYCKMQACWENISKKDFKVPGLPGHVTLSHDDAKDIGKQERATKKVDNEIDLDVVLVSIISKAELVRANASQRRLLSDKSSRALEKLAVGNLSLSRPEKNAMKLLINRLAEEGAPVDSMG